MSPGEARLLLAEQVGCEMCPCLQHSSSQATLRAMYLVCPGRAGQPAVLSPKGQPKSTCWQRPPQVRRMLWCLLANRIANLTSHGHSESSARQSQEPFWIMEPLNCFLWVFCQTPVGCTVFSVDMGADCAHSPIQPKSPAWRQKWGKGWRKGKNPEG